MTDPKTLIERLRDTANTLDFYHANEHKDSMRATLREAATALQTLVEERDSLKQYEHRANMHNCGDWPLHLVVIDQRDRAEAERDAMAKALRDILDSHSEAVDGSDGRSVMCHGQECVIARAALDAKEKGKIALHEEVVRDVLRPPHKR